MSKRSYESILRSKSQFIQTGFHFRIASHVFSHIIRQLDAFTPLLIDIHLATRQLHDNIRRLVTGVVRQVRTDAERAADFSLTILEYLEGLLKIKRIAEDNGLRSRIDTQLLVADNQAVNKLKLIAGVAPYTVKQLSLFPAEIGQKRIRRISIPSPDSPRSRQRDAPQFPSAPHE